MNKVTQTLITTSAIVLGWLFSVSVSADSARWPALPEPVSNNAVAKVKVNGRDILLSFMGLGAGKGYEDIHNKAWKLELDRVNSQWQAIEPVPHVNPIAGRLAAIAVGIDDQAYVFGGFTVDKKHHEVSTQDNYRYDVRANSYGRIADMPVAVDDVALVTYQNRYIYLLGGWHQHGNVNLVQVYDTQNNTWSQATPIPAPAVFGQAAGIADNQLVLCDGVTVTPMLKQARTFTASPVCLFGKIRRDNHLRIDWQLIPHYSVATKQQGTAAQQAVAHYRMAATGAARQHQIIFLGGSDNPYNYDGIGYNNLPSQASNRLYRFDLRRQQWLAPQQITTASMDHRGLILYHGMLLTVGGMVNPQQVTNQVLATPLPRGR